ncbi:MAG: ketopantoate hydroxymethyltransferase [Pelagibacteraceae bacterium]|nr:ketopantoate hydroxymethyltransferase [Pelagibacteraceae bacterium]
MKKLYTWGGKFADRNLTVSDLLENKGKKKFLQTTATNSEEASAAKEAGIDMLLCKSPFIDEIRKGAPDIFLTATIDLALFPTTTEVLNEAFRAMSVGADQIYTARGPHIIEMLSKEDIPVMCHLGLVPRKSSWKGGLRAIGKTAEEAYKLFNEFKTMESAGAFSAECEIILEEVMLEISKKTSLITSSLGSGLSGDIIYLFQNDICGEQENIPRHARSFGNILKLKNEIYRERVNSIKSFKSAVQNQTFPKSNELVNINKKELEAFKKLIS